MKIAINALSAKIGGGATYLKYLMPELARQGSSHEYYLFVSRDYFEKIFGQTTFSPNVKIIKFNTRQPIQRFIAEQIMLPFNILALDIRILFCPANIIPLFAPSRKIVWIQNIFPFIDRKKWGLNRNVRDALLDLFSRWSVSRANTVIVSSDNSLEILISSGVPAKKCRRIYLGVEPFNLQKIETKRMLLSVSNIYQHKNFSTLIQAYSKLDKAIRSEYTLSLVGKTVGKESEKEFKALKELGSKLGLDGQVIFDLDADQSKLANYYASAKLFIMPSLIESFSFPVFEAMAAGLPVIAARSTCLPEVVGEAGLFFDPLNADDLVGQMNKVISDPGLYEDMSNSGIKRAKLFTWDNTVKETLRCLAEHSYAQA